MVNKHNYATELRELELFAGAGGGILGSMLLGHRTVCAVEYDAYARSVLLARQNDGTFPPFPVWDDVRTFDGKPWSGIVDCVSGGFPCQDISAAGKCAGIEGERSGLWKEMARIIREVRPRYAFIENSPMLVTRGLYVVLSDLAAMGFDARWGIVSASDTGAPHQRERIWILAYSNSVNGQKSERQSTGECESNDSQRIFAESSGSGCDKNVSNPNSTQCEGMQRTERVSAKHSDAWFNSGWPTEPELGRVANGVAHRAYRLKAIGNGQVPRVRAAAWSILSANP